MFFYNATVLSRPKLTFILLQFCIKFWTKVQMYIIELCLANFSDLGNVCNKTSVSLTNCYRSLHCEGTQYIADIFLCRPLKRTTTCDDTVLQLMLRYTRLVSTKLLHKNAGMLVKYFRYSNCAENIALSEFFKHISKTGNLSYIKLKRFARLLHVTQRFEYVISYQILYNITYVTTHLSLTNLYKT